MKGEGPVMTITIGPAGFAAIDDDNHPLLEELWKAWVDDEEDEKITWACTRDCVIKTPTRTEATIKMTATGQSRAKLQGDKHKMWSKFHKVDYDIKINDKPLKV